MNPAPLPGQLSDPLGTQRSGRLRTLPQLLLVAGASAFNLVALRVETLPVANLNDSTVHLAMIRWAANRIEAGHLPFDGWFPDFGLGSSQFHHYQSFPHVVAGYVATIFGAESTFSWSLYLLLALWPVSVYLSMRIFGWDGCRSAAAALLSPLVASSVLLGYEHGAYTWQGFGTWAQLWGMWFFPLALALCYRAVTGRGSYVLAAVALGFTMMSHFLTGYLAVMSIGLCVLLHRRDLLRRMWRAAVVVVGALLIASWTIFPFLIDSTWAERSEFGQGTYISDSYGARTVLSRLFTGALFDQGRIPVLTPLLLVGVVVCLWRIRRDDRARFFLYFGALNLVLYFGRPTLGPLADLLPLGGGSLMERYIIGVHLVGIFFAGVGADAIVRWLTARARAVLSTRRSADDVAPRLLVGRLVGAPVLTIIVVVVGLLVLTPAWRERWRYASSGAGMIRYQRSLGATDGRDVIALIETAKSRGGGRIYAGLRSNWGQEYKVGSVPVYAMLVDRSADSIGFTLRTVSLATGIEVRFDESNESHYDLLGVRYLIMPKERRPPVPAKVIESRGRHSLWTVDSGGYLEVVDTAGVIAADRGNIGRQMEVFLASDLPRRKLHPLVEFAGRPPEPPSLGGPAPDRGPGSIEDEIAGPADGVFGGEVDARRRATVMLKASYDPRWRVIVDGRRVTPQMVAPAFVGAVVPRGRHSILFVYEPVPYYGWLFALGFLTIAGLLIGPRLRRGLRRVQPPDLAEPIVSIADRG